MNITPKSGDPVWLLLIGFIVFLVCIGMAIFEAVQQTRLTFFGVTTNATCIHVEKIPSGRSHRLEYTFRFTDKAGAVITVKDIWCTEGTKEGDVIPIVYLPSNPDVVSLSGVKGWGFVIFIGTIIVLIGIFLWHWLR